MSISYPLTLPDADLDSIEIAPETAAAISRSPFSFVEQIHVWSGMRWTARVRIGDRTRAEVEDWLAFLLALNGAEGSFLMGDPLATAPRGSVAGTPVVDGASQTGRTLATRGWTASATGVLLAGDYIQLGNLGTNRRLYKVLQDVDADGAGDANVEIWPRLRSSPVDGQSVLTSNTVGIWRLAADFDWTESVLRYPNVDFSAVEDLRP